MTIRAPYVTPQKQPAPSTSITLGRISLALIVAATSLPFNNSASVTVPVPVKLSAPDQLHTDISNFTNPIPFGGSSGGKPFDLVGLVAPAQAYNPNLYATVAASPFTPPQFGTALSLSSLPTPPRVVPYNQLIYSEVPFSQSDWPRTVAVRYNPPQAQPYNGLTFAPLAPPFVPVDYNKPFSVASVPPSLSLQGYNLNLFGETLVPFNVTADLVRTPNFVQPVQNYNLNLYGQVAVAAAPFAQYDWSKPSPTQIATPQFAPTNINLFTNTVPFALYDWNKPSAYGPSKAALPTSSIALLTAIQAPPFVPVDYSKPYFPRNQIDATQAANPSSFTNPQPFAQYEWAKISFQTPRAPDASQPTNPNLYPPIFVPPVVDDGSTVLSDRKAGGGYYPRRKWEELLEEIRLEKAAMEAPTKAKKAKEAVARAAEAAAKLAEQLEREEAEELARNVVAAERASKAVEAIRLANEILREAAENEEEEELIMLLLTS